MLTHVVMFTDNSGADRVCIVNALDNSDALTKVSKQITEDADFNSVEIYRVTDQIG